MYRIRIHGRGGQGIKTASRILGTALFLAGFEVQDAPRYGAERRGAPIFAYVRAARTPIQERGNIERPDLVVVADETLVPIPAAGVLQGVGVTTVLLIDSAETAQDWQARLNYRGPVVSLPVGGEPRERIEPAFAGVRCAGAAACLLGVIGRERLAQAIAQELGAFSAEVVAASREQALAWFDALESSAGLVQEGLMAGAGEYVRPQWIEVPRDDVHHAAPDIERPATSVQVRTGLWRTMRPVIDYERCRRCAWVCSTLCPDSAIAVEADGRPVIDYEHCKGCLICVAVCPPHAISAIAEHEAQQAGASLSPSLPHEGGGGAGARPGNRGRV
jgi:pyruvate ferredoxin oxidoreductase gamma subunit